MPITYGDIEWPPKYCRLPAALHREYHAWYRGDPAELTAVYGGGATGLSAASPVMHASQYRGGVVGAVARLWWGRPITPNQATTRKHVPAPADLASYSADLLYREPLTLAWPDDTSEPTRARLANVLDEGALHAKLLESGETDSYAGGVYLIGYVDQGAADVPLTAVYPPDRAVPEWRHDVLMAVTFWCQLEGSKDSEVWRHLERHEVTPAGVGMVYHALYLGTGQRLGERRELSDRPETADLATRVDADGGIATGIDVLDVQYVPNVLPNREIEGSPLGRSDYAGVTDLFDGLDEVWSSWMRDIRLAKGRLVVPRAYLQSYGPGQGAMFNAEQEIFTSVNTLGGPDRGMELSQVQFAIRVVEHEATAAAHWRAIMRSAGLSQDAFGEEVSGGAATAKEIGRRGERTAATRGRKILYARPAVTRHVRVLQALDVAHFPQPGVSQSPVRVDWPAELPDLETLSRSLQMLDAAAAISTRVKIKMLHPRWTDVEVLEEEQRLGADRAAPTLDDPDTFTGE